MRAWLDRKAIEVTNYMHRMMKSEKGDTNFISILIILGIVVLLAGVFLGFKDTIVEKVGGIVDGLEFE